jgi:hypothetical protein
MRQHRTRNLAPHPTVVPRAGGVSSTPRPIGSIAGVSGILDRPPQCAIAHKADDDSRGYSRGAFRPGFANRFAQTRGRGECRVLAAPAVPCARDGGRGAHEHTGTAGALRHSPRNGFTAYAALSPETNSSCLRHRRIDGVRLTRAKARPAIPISAAGAAASTAFRPTSVTIAIRPSWRAGTGGVVGLIWGWREEVYFCRQDWTGQITLIGLEKFVSPRIALQDPLAIGHSRSPGGSARQAHPSKLTRVRSSACRRCQAIGNGPRTAKRLSPVRRSNRFEFRVTHGDNSA